MMQMLYLVTSNDFYLMLTSGRHWDLSCQHHIVLPHACFVYDAIYHSSLDHVILTAGYDELIYIWTVHSTESRYGQVNNYVHYQPPLLRLVVFTQVIWSPWLH